MDMFDEVLKQLSELMHVSPPLHSDEKSSCLIEMPGKIPIYLEMDRQQQHLVIGCNLGELPAGPYRNNLLKEALKANATLPRHTGTLAYSTKNNNLVVFDRLDLEEVSGQAVFNTLQKILPKAHQWRDAIRRGEVPQIITAAPPPSTSTMFGIKR